MKNTLAGFALLMSFGAMTQVTIGFVDLQRLLDTMPSKKAAVEKYIAFKKELEEEIEMMETEFERQVKSLRTCPSPVGCSFSSKKLADRQRDLEERSQTHIEELRLYEIELNKPITDRIQTAITIVSERHKLSVVIDTSSTLYVATDVDITNAVIAELLKLEEVSESEQE